MSTTKMLIAVIGGILLLLVAFAVWASPFYFMWKYEEPIYMLLFVVSWMPAAGFILILRGWLALFD